MHDTPWLLCYDIRDAKRLRRVHRIAANLGFPINYSVFYLELIPAAYTALVRQLKKVIDQSVDDVRLYPCCRLGQIVIYGRPLPAGIYLFQQGQACIEISKNDHVDGMDVEVNDNMINFVEPLGNRLVNGLWLG